MWKVIILIYFVTIQFPLYNKWHGNQSKGILHPVINNKTHSSINFETIPMSIQKIISSTKGLCPKNAVIIFFPKSVNTSSYSYNFTAVTWQQVSYATFMDIAGRVISSDGCFTYNCIVWSLISMKDGLRCDTYSY